MAESAASAPPPRPGPPLIPPPRASNVPAAGFEQNLGANTPANDYYDEAEPAFGASPFEGGFDDGDGPPLEELESQMRGELAERDGAAFASPSAHRAAANDEDDEEGADRKSEPLPDLDTLVARLPEEVRETLDELFRARFVSVKKLPKRLFEVPKGKSAGGA